jgi:phospholipid:diacylglycerol acyltransferase
VRSCVLLLTDPATGMDPPGIKLRAAQGLEAVDYVLPGYNVWGEMIESLADIGYDSNMLYSASYDWRLSLHKLEERDGYFTKLQSNMELSLRVHGQKAAVLSHSFGDTVFRYFLSWVSSPLGGEWLRRCCPWRSSFGGNAVSRFT